MGPRPHCSDAGQARTDHNAGPRGTVDLLDAAQLLYRRDYASRHQVVIAEGEATRFGNGAVLFAYATDGSAGKGWASRDGAFSLAGPDWGASHSLPVACAPLTFQPKIAAVDPERLGPASGAAVVILGEAFNGTIGMFEEKMAKAIARRQRIAALRGNG